MDCDSPLSVVAVFAARRALFVSTMLVLASTAQAGRVGNIAIYVDGELCLQGSTFDEGDRSPAAVWRCLNTNELWMGEGLVITPEPADDLRATLRGAIEVDVQYGGKAEVAILHLLRDTPDDGWRVVAEDVEKMANNIGLQNNPMLPTKPNLENKPSSPRDSNRESSTWIWIAVGGTVVAAILATFAIHGKRT